MAKVKNPARPPIRPIRDAFLAQLPIVAALLAIGYQEEQLDFDELAQDAITLMYCIEDQLES
jgi:hypothetical protein